MALGQKRSGKAMSMPAGMAIACLMSFALTVAGAYVLACLLEKEIIQWQSAGYGIMLILFVVPMVGTMIARTGIKRQHILISQMFAAVYFVLLLGITLLFFGGQFEAVGVTALLVWGGSTATVFVIPVTKREGRRTRKYRLSH